MAHELPLLAVIPAVGILMFLGVPSANGPFSIYMAPDWFRTLHDFLPMPAAVETVRSILYFDGDTAWEHLQVLGVWGLVSLALVILIDAIKPVHTEHDFGDLVQTPVVPEAVAVAETEGAEPASVRRRKHLTCARQLRVSERSMASQNEQRYWIDRTVRDVQLALRVKAAGHEASRS